MKTPRPTRRPDRYTVLLVPENGAGVVKQRTVAVRDVKLVVGAVASIFVAFMLSSGVALYTLPAFSEHDRLVHENRALTVRLTEVQGELAELDPLIQRVQAYDEQLRSLAARNALPGFGPLDANAMAARDAWIDQVVGDEEGGSEIDPDEMFDALRSIDLGALAENLAIIQAASEAMPQMWPVENGVVTSGFGMRRNPFGRDRWKFHTGIDIGVDYGTPIVSTGGGVVTFSDWDEGHGRTVEIDHGTGIVTRYCHASQLLANPGDEVLAGDMIALVGSSGMSTGPHLHYEILIDGDKVDPRLYLPLHR